MVADPGVLPCPRSLLLVGVSALDKLIEQERSAHATQSDDQIADDLGDDDEGTE